MLKVDHLTYQINGRTLLQDVSFDVQKGEFVAILGANGAGKSTLMNLLSGEKRPSKGTIEWKGQRFNKIGTLELAQTRAMLSQQFSVSLAFTVRELVLMGRYPHFQTQASAKDWQIVDEVMQVCGVSEFSDRVITNLSGGEQQRVHLARVLAQIWGNKNALLLLDEPVSALDMRFQQQVLAIAKSLSRLGMIVMVIIHDVNLASLYADRILMLKQGRKAYDGKPQDVLTQENIHSVFSVDSKVFIDDVTGKPFVRLDELVYSEDLNTKGI